MKSTFRLIYKFVGFIFLFFLLGTLFVFIETVMIENNTQSFIDESGILQNKYEKKFNSHNSLSHLLLSNNFSNSLVQKKGNLAI